MTELIFKKVDETIIKDVNQYVKDWVIDHPYGEVTIGCDSQQHTHYIKYSIVIVMHVVDEFKIGHGAHVISSSITDRSKNLKSDIYSKLWAEAEYTIKAAQMIDGCTKDIKIHLDYNSKETEYSNVLYSAGLGYVKGMGYEAEGKPHAWAATHVADDICKGKSTARVKR
jgi:predicted RNase H-related nuclease YkuK (DUF458 family)